MKDLSFYIGEIRKNPKIFLKYLSYICRHKWFVFLECVKRRLILQGLIHDWHKMLPSEFFPYMMHFRGSIHTGRNKTGYYKPTNSGDPDFDKAWFHHVQFSRHHWQCWCVAEEGNNVVAFEMPIKYRKEMLADWFGAGRAQGTPNVQAWYKENGHKMCLGPETRKWIEKELGVSSFHTRRITKEKRGSVLHNRPVIIKSRKRG